MKTEPALTAEQMSDEHSNLSVTMTTHHLPDAVMSDAANATRCSEADKHVFSDSSGWLVG